MCSLPLKKPIATSEIPMSDKVPTSIVRIDPVPEFFSVGWMLGSRCNYDCMYCPTELHDKTSRHHDLETLQSCWSQIAEKNQNKNLTYKISFTGGELTTNKHFLPFIAWLRTYPVRMQIFFTSNGSASLDYYKKLAPLVNGITFSTHGEYIDEKKFFSTAQNLNAVMIRPERSFHINIMDEIWNRDRIEIYKQFCETHQISHSVNEIDFSTQTRTHFLMEAKHNIYDIQRSRKL